MHRETGACCPFVPELCGAIRCAAEVCPQKGMGVMHWRRISGVISRISTTAILFTTATFACHTLAAEAQSSNSGHSMPAAGPNRPASVPDGYVVTPFGYFHASCVQSLAKGERILPDRRIEHADGSVGESAAVCTYAHYTASGKLVRSNSASASQVAANTTNSSTSPEINGWIESASITTNAGTSYGSLNARWTVPPPPKSDDGQLLYFFPGLEDINNTESILQPVLTWYEGQWYLQSWNCCLSGIATSSPPVDVSPGDRIYGSVTSICGPGTPSCATWNVLSLDMTTGESTELADTPSDGQVFNWAFGGVLEPYYVISCDDFPPDKEMSFDQVTVFNEGLRPVHDAKWATGVNTTDTPQCDFGVNGDPKKVTMSY